MHETLIVFQNIQILAINAFTRIPPSSPSDNSNSDSDTPPLSDISVPLDNLISGCLVKSRKTTTYWPN